MSTGVYRAIPPVQLVQDRTLRLCLEAIRGNQLALTRQGNGVDNSALRVSDLLALGHIGVEDGTLYSKLVASSGPSAAAGGTAVSPGEDTAVLTLDATGGLAQGTEFLGLTLPKDAYVIRAWYDVLTTFTSNTDAATIRLGVATDDPGGIVAAIAISDISTPWDAGLHEGVPDGAVANFTTKATAERELQATVGAEDLTNGELRLFVRYALVG